MLLTSKLLAIALIIDHRGADMTLAGAAKAGLEGLATVVPSLKSPESVAEARPDRREDSRSGPALSPPNGLGKPRGFLAARVGHGIYLGSPLPKRPELLSFSTRERDRDQARTATKRGSSKLLGGGQGLQGTLYFTEQSGLNLEARVGRGFFAGLSYVYRW